MLDVGYERDKLRRVQAQLLITWWWDRKDDGGRNMRACTTDAINTAQSIGMHRWFVDSYRLAFAQGLTDCAGTTIRARMPCYSACGGGSGGRVS